MSAQPEVGTPSVDDHAFEPRGAWWTLCTACGLAMAAHTRSSVEPELAPRAQRETSP